jgi:hypothetical protein
MRLKTLPNVLSTFPEVLKNSIASVIKHTTRHMTDPGYSRTETTYDQLFLLAFPEVSTRGINDPDYCADIPKQIYQGYSDNATRIKENEDGIPSLWLMRNSASSSNFRAITAEGMRGVASPQQEGYFFPAFCISNKPAVRVGSKFITEEDIENGFGGGGGFVASSTEPDSTNVLWIDKNSITGGLKYYNGSAWVHVPVAAV